MQEIEMQEIKLQKIEIDMSFMHKVLQENFEQERIKLKECLDEISLKIEPKIFPLDTEAMNRAGEKVATIAKYIPHFKPGKEMRDRVNAQYGTPIIEASNGDEDD